MWSIWGTWPPHKLEILGDWAVSIALRLITKGEASPWRWSQLLNFSSSKTGTGNRFLVSSEQVAICSSLNWHVFWIPVFLSTWTCYDHQFIYTLKSQLTWNFTYLGKATFFKVMGSLGGWEVLITISEFLFWPQDPPITLRQILAQLL